MHQSVTFLTPNQILDHTATWRAFSCIVKPSLDAKIVKLHAFFHYHEKWTLFPLYISAVGEFSSQELTLCADSYLVSIPSLSNHQCQIKDLEYSAKSAGGRLHPNLHTPLTQWSRKGWLWRCPGIVWELIWNSSQVTYQEDFGQSSQLAEPLWTNPGIKSGISVCELISTLKKKSAGGEWMVEHPLKILARTEEATTTTFPAP